MRLIAVGIFVGALLLQGLSALPSTTWLAALPLGVVLVFIRPLRLAGAVMCGFLWALWHATSLLSLVLPPALEGKPAVVEGEVLGIPEFDHGRTRLLFLVQKTSIASTPPFKVRLYWEQAPSDLAAGQRWRLRVKLKQQHGMANPGTFDQEAWFFAQRIRASGYVVKNADSIRIGDNAWRLDRMRQAIAESIYTQSYHFGGVLGALAVGDRGRMTQQQWDIFRKTGTSHLMAISGMNIGFVAGWVFFLVRWIWSRMGHLPLWQPAPRVAAVAALLAAVAYATLVGFIVPTQRALIMAAIVLWSLVSLKVRSPSRVFAVALIAVIALDPLTADSPSFLLSFFAVAIILLGAARRHTGWRQALRMQWDISLSMFPLLMFLFGALALVSPLANLIAVPWVSIGVVPPVLLGMLSLPLSTYLAHLFFSVADWSLFALWPILTAFAQPDWNYVAVAQMPAWKLAAAGLGTIILLAPRGVPGRAVGLIWLLPLLTHQPAVPDTGRFEFTLLDVGQGLAAVIQTREHTLVFDTGAKFGEDFNAGTGVIVPFLHSKGIQKIDRLILSHGDNDHFGGAVPLLQRMSVAEVISSDTALIDGSKPCARGMRWNWDGVEFLMLHPSREIEWQGNNSSCVMQIHAGGQALLLTGDIEDLAEISLIEAYGTALRSQVLVAPHHGSATSSTEAFVDLVQPNIVLFPAGYRNRFRHPHPSVVERYRRSGARLFSSAKDGALEALLGDPAAMPLIQAYRNRRHRYWMPVWKEELE